MTVREFINRLSESYSDALDKPLTFLVDISDDECSPMKISDLQSMWTSETGVTCQLCFTMTDWDGKPILFPDAGK